MLRRTFFKQSAASLGSLFLLAKTESSPTILLSSPPPPGTFPELADEVRRFRVGLRSIEKIRWEIKCALDEGRPVPHPYPPDDEDNYWARVYRIGHEYFYQEGGIVVPCTKDQFKKCSGNPTLYYFSTALRLHLKVLNARHV